MATTYTPNYHLGKQEDRSDKFVMKVITDNMDVIDEQLKATDDKATAAAAGLKYKGAVNYYSDLPNDAELGDAYTVLYAGSSGSVADGTEYVWGELNNTAQWIDFSKDTYTKAEVNGLLAAFGTAATKNVPSSGDASSTEVVMGNDSRLSDSRTPTAHNQAANTINAMTGYSKPSSTSAIGTGDTLNAAIGKLEKKADDNQNNISIEDITNKVSMETGYTINTSYSKLYKQGKHIFGNLVLKKSTGVYDATGDTVATITDYPPILTVVNAIGLTNTVNQMQNIGWIYISSARESPAGSITIRDAGGTINNCAVIQIDYVTA